ncbi:unnamed protein product [Owenia fusiformis]|uniref:DNA-directed RNA polymerase III subunit RPC6 n=1 Tax=Owenia fusiformis TaxID=6347 RepID=A0A8J1U5W6_OWEFU|nr:unnamed protein product [Owenia fusiformis]
MATNIKDEPMEVEQVEARILELCLGSVKGVTDQQLQTLIPNISPTQRVTAVNKLLQNGKIDLMKSGSQLVYKVKDPDSTSKVKGGDNQEKLVYQIIEESGNKGIWIRDIRWKSNLLLTQVNKILKSLESKKLIKAVKSVAASKKKVYMLFNLEPDRSVTGGAWYSDQDFEAEFVDILNQQCFKFLEQRLELAADMNVDPAARMNKAYATSLDITKYISELGISKVELSVEDIETILNTLIYDGKVEHTIMATATGQKKLYRAMRQITQSTGLMRTPCGVCPVFKDCKEGGIVSPSTCVYMKDWLDINF